MLLCTVAVQFLVSSCELVVQHYQVCSCLVLAILQMLKLLIFTQTHNGVQGDSVLCYRCVKNLCLNRRRCSTRPSRASCPHPGASCSSPTACLRGRGRASSTSMAALTSSTLGMWKSSRCFYDIFATLLSPDCVLGVSVASLLRNLCTTVFGNVGPQT